MRSLTPTLLAAQKQATALPYVSAVFSDYHGEASRIRLTRHYQGTEPAYFSAVVGAGDGSLIRARIDPATHVLYSQRVAGPTPTSSFGTWTSHGTVSSTGAVALTIDGANVFMFYVHTDNLTLKLKQSADNGTTYGAATTIVAASTSVSHLTAAVSPAGDRLLLWVEGAAIYSSRHSGGSWSTRTAWTNSAASITGIACRHWLDFDVIVCGTETTTSDAKVWSAIYGDGAEHAPDVWSALSEITTANAGSSVSFHSPALELLQSWRLFFVEKYSGTQAYSRLQWSTMDGATTFTNQLWREPTAFDYEGDYGIAASASNLDGELWLSSPAGVWSGRSPTNPDLDVSDDVVEASADIDQFGGRARLVLRNDAVGNEPAGRYFNYGSDDLATLQRGARLQLTPGYRTSEGPETPVNASYWVESIEQVTGPAARLIVEARDAWWLLERWRAKRQFYWPAGTHAVSQILQFVCARAGLGLSFLSDSDAITDLQPAFTIHAGESGRTAVQRLVAMVPDVAFAQAGALRVRLPQPDDAVDYTYVAAGITATSEHAMVSGRYRELAAATNRARVFGSAVLSEAFDFEAIESVGERNLQIIDVNLADATEAADRAARELDAAQREGRNDEIRVAGVNCGQELYDAVSITDTQAGLTNAKRRVLGLSWCYQTGSQPRYDMTLKLGNP